MQSRKCVMDSVDSQARVMIVGVNPFEDLPGYQLLGMLRGEFNGNLLAADDSEPAVVILGKAGAHIHSIPHPSRGLDAYVGSVLQLCDSFGVSTLLPGADAHTSALAQAFYQFEPIQRMCPHLRMLASRKLYNKWHSQNWLSLFGRTPARGLYDSRSDLEGWVQKNGYPVMVKGLRKGASKCIDLADAIVAERNILKNPANQGVFGGTYLEQPIEGEEHSLLLVVGRNRDVIAQIPIRKIAITKLGTTLAAEIQESRHLKFDYDRLLASIDCPTVLEIESKIDADGNQWVFEVNFRFPSWIGALGTYGIAVVRSFLAALANSDRLPGSGVNVPEPGSIIYRLPESGLFPLRHAFLVENDIPRVDLAGRPRDGRSELRLLWPGCEAHQFLIK